MNLPTNVDGVRTRQDLANFIRLLQQDVETNSDEWEHDSLADFFEAIAAWIESMDQAYKNRGQEFSEEKPWSLVAEILLAGKYYE